MSTNLVKSKSKIEPLQATSIPRLKLLSAMLVLRLTRALANAFKLSVDLVTFWCYKMNVLWWIGERSKKFKPLVASRVNEIQSTINPMIWKHVPAKTNPASLVIRGRSYYECVDF